MSNFTARRAAKGTSDAVSLTCSCPPGSGLVLLFFRYFANQPVLDCRTFQSTSWDDFASEQKDLCSRLGLSGKIRLGVEGFNCTVAGRPEAAQAYMESMSRHWSCTGLGLDDADARNKFFKPTAGCPCVFGRELSIKIVHEIVPFGNPKWQPAEWFAADASRLIYLEPEAFHSRLLQSDRSFALVDARNQYESAVGTFTAPPVADARPLHLRILPPTRRFSEFPAYIDKCALPPNLDVVSFCTGGIRCEKAARYISDSGAGRQVYTLQGGIVAYLEWYAAEVGKSKRKWEDCLFKGRNFVFDARGSNGGSPDVRRSSSTAIPDADHAS